MHDQLLLKEVAQVFSTMLVVSTVKFVEESLAISLEVHLLLNYIIGVVKNRSIDEAYVEGVSITHGHDPRQQIWSYAAGSSEHRISQECSDSKCPCNGAPVAVNHHHTLGTIIIVNQCINLVSLTAML